MQIAVGIGADADHGQTSIIRRQAGHRRRRRKPQGGLYRLQSGFGKQHARFLSILIVRELIFDKRHDVIVALDKRIYQFLDAVRVDVGSDRNDFIGIGDFGGIDRHTGDNVFKGIRVRRDNDRRTRPGIITDGDLCVASLLQKRRKRRDLECIAGHQRSGGEIQFQSVGAVADQLHFAVRLGDQNRSLIGAVGPGNADDIGSDRLFPTSTDRKGIRFVLIAGVRRGSRQRHVRRRRGGERNLLGIVKGATGEIESLSPGQINIDFNAVGEAGIIRRQQQAIRIRRRAIVDNGGGYTGVGVIDGILDIHQRVGAVGNRNRFDTAVAGGELDGSRSENIVGRIIDSPGGDLMILGQGQHAHAVRTGADGAVGGGGQNGVIGHGDRPLPIGNLFA